MNIKLKIDVLKINKAKLYAGEKGTYLNCVLIETPNGQYGDFMIVEESTKEEREANQKGTILGNASYIKPKQAPAQTQTPQPAYDAKPIVNDGLPF